VLKRFQPEFMEVEFNFSCMSSIFTPDASTVVVVGHFRSNSDYIGVTFNSKDARMHRNARYPESTDYTGTTLSFNASFQGNVAPFNNHDHKPALVVVFEDDTEMLATLGFMSSKSPGFSSSDSFTGETKLNHEWIEWDSETVWWGKNVLVGYRDIFDEDGMYVGTEEIYEWQEGYATRGVDYAIDYEFGKIYLVAGSSIPYDPEISVSYTYNNHQTYVIDFDNLKQGTHPDNSVPIPSSGIKKVIIPVIPIGYTEGSNKLLGRSDEVRVTFSNWTVSGGDIGDFPPPTPAHPFRVAEGYDDEYYRNPRRIVQAMHHLGYRKIINLYIGASHYYDKCGPSGGDSLDYTIQYLIPEAGVCTAAREWFRYLLKAMREFGFEDIVVSISMENLQMPEEWKQRIYTGDAGRTGWDPPTSFFSPTNTEARAYWETIARNYLDICVEEGFKPILQLGEPWWWWQEFQPGDINTPFPGKPPCFYDEATKNKFRRDMGRELPVYKTSNIPMEGENLEVIEWLRDELGDFSNFAKSIVESYPGGEYTVLFFPPSVLDTERVPEALRIVNYPEDYWKIPNLDFIQIEDYDWVIHDNERHMDIYEFAWRNLGYQPHVTHYFSGFAWEQYNMPLDVQWGRVEEAAVRGLSFGMTHVFIWAGTQIRRDSWVPEIPVRYYPNIKNRTLVHIVKGDGDGGAI